MIIDSNNILGCNPQFHNKIQLRIQPLVSQDHPPIPLKVGLHACSVYLSDCNLACETNVYLKSILQNYDKLILDSATDPKEVAITSVSEQYEGNGVIVTLEWTQENPLYSYNVSVIPPAEITFTGKARAQMKVSYNTSYNVSVMASSPCGRSDATNFTELYYSEYN